MSQSDFSQGLVIQKLERKNTFIKLSRKGLIVNFKVLQFARMRNKLKTIENFISFTPHSNIFKSNMRCLASLVSHKLVKLKQVLVTHDSVEELENFYLEESPFYVYAFWEGQALMEE